MAHLFTIGHSNRDAADFLRVLQAHGITAIADVRSHPYSRFMPDYNREPLKSRLLANQISYVFLGAELGARRDEPECYVDGKVSYPLVEMTSEFQAGLERLRGGASEHRIALMCSEKDPVECHRAILISRSLREEFEISHILDEDEIESHADLEVRLMRLRKQDHPTLFDSREELLELAYAQQAERIAYAEAKETRLAEDP